MYARRLGLMAFMAVAPLALLALGFVAYVAAGVWAGGSLPTGTIAGLGVREAATIVRDARGIPHIRAKNEHDAYFLEGYAQGTDRLFQLDIYRRLVTGRLSEVFGRTTLDADRAARLVDVAAIADAQLRSLTPAERASVDAFAAGVNAAIRTRPRPPEFRVLAYAPQAWTARDSIAVSFATVLALTDTWDGVLTRADVERALGPAAKDAFFPITDPRYDAPLPPKRPAPVAPLPTLHVTGPTSLQFSAWNAPLGSGFGSNEVAAGATLTKTRRALLANDPHLELRIPGVWWLVDLQAPGLHVAGATLAGVPGVILGHNAHVAWGATNGNVADVAIYKERFRSATSDEYLAGTRWLRAARRTETFAVRFSKPVTQDYLRTRNGFIFEDRGSEKFAAAWTADSDRRASLEAFDGVARARSAAGAVAAFERYIGPTQNYVFADDAGNVAYHLAGEIAIDEAWGLSAHDGPTATGSRHYVPYRGLPHVDPGRGALVYTANNRTYGMGYPYRLTADFAPPYRAARIAEDLRKRPYDVADFSAIQADVESLPERELALEATSAFARKHIERDPDIGAANAVLRAFDGRFTGQSRAAVWVTALRRAATERLVRYHLRPELAYRYLSSDGGAAFVALMRALRERPHGWVPHDDFDGFLVSAMRDGIAELRRTGTYDSTWSDVGARTAQHPLASFGLAMWNGVRFPGLGDAYAPHVQAPANAQSFRAVWDVGNWRAGGIVIPQGESGEPGSPYYRDGAALWLSGSLVPLPFDDAAVRAAAVTTLDLTPAASAG